MKKLVLIFASISVALLLNVNCGKKEEAKTEETPAAGSNVGGLVKKYIDFVDKFCALSEKIKDVPAAEKASALKEFSTEASNLQTLGKDIESEKDKATADQKKAIDDASARAAGCAKTASGVNNIKAPTVDDAKKALGDKVPSVPGM